MTTLGGRLRRLDGAQLTLGIALAALGFLVAAQLRSEGPRVRYTTQERSPLVETALGLQANQEALKARILDLNRQIRDIQGTTEGNAVLVRNLNDQLEGPGIVLELDDSSLPVPTGATAADYRVTPQDLRTVVDALWRAGAEAISINGERITAVTGITDVGGSVLVNYAYVTPPYQVTAIGTKGLYERLTAIDSFGELVRTRADAFGIKLSFAEPGTVVVPAFAGPVTLNEARVPADASVTGSEPPAAPAASASGSAVGGSGAGSGSTDGSGGPVGAP